MLRMGLRMMMLMLLLLRLLLLLLLLRVVIIPVKHRAFLSVSAAVSGGCNCRWNTLCLLLPLLRHRVTVSLKRLHLHPSCKHEE
uniref:Putative secreted peptide n=1 Tax=Anopheles braziliensis TaxID=58242 RepID=A0A2M3ZSD9_9DIPT